MSFGPSDDSADDTMLTSSASYERSSASNVTSLTPGEMLETDWTENPVGSSLKNPGFTKEPSSAVSLSIATTTIDDRTPVFTADNPLTTRLSTDDNLSTPAESSFLDLPTSVATGALPVDVSTQKLTTSDIRLTSSLIDNLLASVSKASDVLPSSDNALNSLFTSVPGTTDNSLADLTAAETNNGRIGTSMLLDDQLPTSDILLVSSFTTDNPQTPVSMTDKFSTYSADDALNPLYISNERSVLDTAEASLLISSSLGSPSATRESLSSATSESLSSATSISSFGPEVKIPRGTISDKLDLPSDHHTASDDDGQSWTAATDNQSSETMVPRNHVTSPTHVTGNRPALSSFDRGFLFEEYNNRVQNRNESPSPTQSSESNALHISTNDVFSASLTSSVSFVNSTSEPSRASSNFVQFSIVFGTMSAFVLALLLLNCVAIFFSAKRKDRRHNRRRRPGVARNISTISFRQISTQVDATVINVIVDEEEEEEDWTDDNVDLLTNSPEEIGQSSPSSSSSAAAAAAAAAAAEKPIPGEGEDGCEVPATRCAGLESGALEEEEEEVGVWRSPGATGGAGERQRRRPGESRRNGDAKGLRTTGRAEAGSTRGGESSSGTQSLPPRTSLQCTSRPSADPLSNVSTFTRTTTTTTRHL